MRYSIRGSIRTQDGEPIVADINRFSLWRLVTADEMDEEGYAVFTFEAWVNTESDKTALFDLLKPHVDTHSGAIDWHECTHDEPEHIPCVIIETYTVG
jgi:hypothetical protein